MNTTLPPALFQALLQGSPLALAVFTEDAAEAVFTTDSFPHGSAARAASWIFGGDPLRVALAVILETRASRTDSLEHSDTGERYPAQLRPLDERHAVLELLQAPALAGNGHTETEQRLRSIIDSAPFPIALYLGREMRVAYANTSLMDVWGKGYDVIGKTYYEVLPELRSQGVYEILDGVYTSGRPYNVRNQRIALEVNGRMKTSYFNYSFTPVFDQNGAVYGVLNTAADVTDSNESRYLLEESELFAKSIIENSPVAKMVLTGEEMVIKTINGNMLQMLGRGREIVGQPFADALPELRDSPMIYRLRHVLATGETYTEPEGRLEFVRYGKPYTGYYNYIYKALPNISGEIYGIIITATEITDLVNTRKRIEEAQNTLEGAISLAGLATWSLRPDDGVITCSQRMRDWHGFDPGETITIEKITALVPEAEQSRMKGAAAVLKNPDSRHDYDQEYTIRNRQTGAIHIVHALGTLSRDDAGRPLRWSGTAQDVTQQRRAQLALEQLVEQRTEELAASNEELQTTNEELADVNNSLLRSNEELAQYAYVASHDLQEPLRKIRLFSGMLQEQLGEDGDATSLVARISQSAARMHQLIRDLLEFSRLLKSDELLTLVNLNDVVQAVVTDFELTIREKDARLDIGPLPSVEGVSLQMNQLFYNLIGNALKFSAPGRPPEIRIRCGTVAPDVLRSRIARPLHHTEYYEISISDNGIGLDTEYAEQIFEVFKRLHNRESYPGSGIGLALCRRIVNNHSGHLDVESAPGEGSTFRILLPADRQP